MLRIRSIADTNERLMSQVRFYVIALSALALGVLSAQLVAQEAVQTVGNAWSAEDLYMAGGRVEVLADVAGDAVVAGGTVTVTRPVHGDVLVAAGMATLTGDVGDDIRAAGGSVTITGSVGGDVIAAGGTVTLGSNSTISGRAWLSGGSVHIGSHVIRDLRVVAGTVVVTGEVDGDVKLIADKIRIEPTAVIKGNLSYHSPNEAVVDEGARIEGQIARQEIDLVKGGDSWAKSIGSALVFYLSLAVSAMVLWLLLPNASHSSVTIVRQEPLLTLGMGLLVVVVTPFVSVLLCALILGIPLGAMVFAIYFVALLVGFLVALACIGQAGFQLLGRDTEQSKTLTLLSILAAAVTVLVVSFIPFIGSLALLIMVFMGVGAVTVYSCRWYKKTQDQGVTAPPAA